MHGWYLSENDGYHREECDGDRITRAMKGASILLIPGTLMYIFNSPVSYSNSEWEIVLKEIYIPLPSAK